MATINCRWDEPASETDDWNDWIEAKRLAAQLPADWKVNCGLVSNSGFLPIRVEDAAGRTVQGLDNVQWGNHYRALVTFLRRLIIHYTGTPGGRRQFDEFVQHVKSIQLPDFEGSVQGDSLSVTVSLRDPESGKSWGSRGRPDELENEFEEWLRTLNIVRRI
jgi:hypothetical protein